MSDEGRSTGADQNEAAQKEWRRPTLQKLPITATATAKVHFGNEGGCVGKGDAGNCLS